MRMLYIFHQLINKLANQYFINIGQLPRKGY